MTVDFVNAASTASLDDSNDRAAGSSRDPIPETAELLVIVPAHADDREQSAEVAQ